MTTADDDFLRALRSTFKVEAAEHLQAIDSGLRELEKLTEPADQLPVIETIYRAAHSLKGAARAVDFGEIESLCQSLESSFAAWKRAGSYPSRSVLDDAHRAIDLMADAMAPSKTAAKTGEVPASSAPSALSSSHGPAAASLPSTASSPSPARPAANPTPLAQPTQSSPHASDPETVRVPVAALDSRLLEAEEMLAAKLASGQRAADIGQLTGQFEIWRKEWSKLQPRARALRRGTEREDFAPCAGEITALTDFFDWTHDYLRTLEAKAVSLRRAAEQDHLVVARLVDDLLENSKKLLMLPLATLSTLLHKIVRDLCRDQGKEADLVVRGEDVKIDKRILEELKDPLIHLLRNSIDHGIEPPAQRRRAGKAARATIALTISQVNGSQVQITISDDGAGIDVDKVKAAAVRRGIVSAEAAETLDHDAALSLAFEADVSTSPMITQVSGRGLGLAIVREKAEKLGGRVTMESRPEVGTTFRLSLPLTLATFRGVLVESAKRLFIVPTAQVERVTRFRKNDVQTVEGRNTLVANGRAVSLVDLAEVLQLPHARRPDVEADGNPAVLLGAGEQRTAFAVDAVHGEREVLVKTFSKPLSRVWNIAGATVLGTGEVAPILNVTDLLKSARHAGATMRGITSPQQPQKDRARKVLVAEDSITSRMLLKGILESAGYEVKTAVDGMEAYTTLRAERFDVIVSDVEMPRLNGFDLTARIRADRALTELPVVLVTALESREDRERGIDVGANAYLVKSNLDQSNLLAALRQLT
jgi:two-component system chemotaxis sensor kinase CheA